MKFIIVVAITLMGIITCQAQSVNVLDAKNGFKQFKFGLAPISLKNIRKITEFGKKIKNMTYYEYVGTDMETQYDVKVNSILLTFFKNKLAIIEVTFGSPTVEYTEDEYYKVQSFLVQTFGNSNQKLESQTRKMLNSAGWKGEKVVLEHTRSDLNKGEDDRLNFIIGEICLYDLKLNQAMLNDAF